MNFHHQPTMSFAVTAESAISRGAVHMPLSLGQDFGGSFFPPHQVIINDAAEQNNKQPRIPWLKRSRAINFKNTEMYLKVLPASSQQKTSVKQRLFDALNEIFPRYLVPRYHSMDCKSLATFSPRGHIFENVAHFLFVNQAFGPIFCRSLTDQMVQKNLATGTKHFSLLDFSHLVPEALLDECKSAEEFLLEPWVLVQLPFQPVIFYQWTVAVLAEALRLQKKLADFYTVAIPRQYGDAIGKLFSINEDLLQFAIRSLCYYGKVCEKPFDEFLQKANVVFISECSKIIPTVKFVISKECRNIVEAMKSLAWNSSNDRNDLIVASMDNLCFETFDVFLNRSFWEGSKSRNFLVKNELLSKNDESPSRLVEMFNNAPHCEFASLKELKKLVVDQIIKPRRLAGESREKILDTVGSIGSKLKCFYEMYSKYIGTSSEKGSSVQRDGGIILDIINLHSDVKVAEALGLMTQYIFHTLVTTTNSSIFINAADCKGPKMTYDSIVDALNKVQPSDEWSFESILKRLKSSCPKQTMQFERSWKTAKIVYHFEARIKYMVISMIEKQHQSIAGTYKFHVEQQIVQYLLPCVVSSILLIEKDRAVSKTLLREYIDFVHLLLCTYEKDLYVFEAPWNPSQSPYASFKRSYTLYHTWLDTDCEIILKVKFNQSISLYDTILKLFLLEKEQPGEPYLANNFSSFMDLLLIQYYTLVSRISHCMDQLGWTKDVPNRVGSFTHLSFHGNLSPLAACMHTIYRLRAAQKSKLYSMPEELLSMYKMDVQRMSQQNLVEPSKALTLEQILGLVVFYGIKHYTANNTEGVKRKFDIMPYDDFGFAVKSVLLHDWWKLKHVLASIFKGSDFVDLSLISLEEAKKNACYAEALKKLTPKGKLFMKTSGEVTFFPIKHCRWCGLVNVKKFRLCPECKDDPEYPDIHFFCSENCETLCLDAQHIEEHARFEMVKLKICH